MIFIVYNIRSIKIAGDLSECVRQDVFRSPSYLESLLRKFCQMAERKGNMDDNTSAINPAKLFVGNLTYSVNDEQLRELFSQYGEVTEATVLLERRFGPDNGRPPRSRGMGFVTFADAEAAEKAIAALHDQDFEGRKLIVAVAKPKTDRPNRGGYNNGGGNRW